MKIKKKINLKVTTNQTLKTETPNLKTKQNKTKQERGMEYHKTKTTD